MKYSCTIAVLLLAALAAKPPPLLCPGAEPLYSDGRRNWICHTGPYAWEYYPGEGPRAPRRGTCDKRSALPWLHCPPAAEPQSEGLSR
jgi:hypothetical protein